MPVAGKAVYYFYYRPLSRLKSITEAGGPVNYSKIKQGEQAMRKAATQLKFEFSGTLPYQVYFLTGRKFWHLTAFCIYSLAKVTQGQIKPVFVDDGTLDASLIRHIKQQFPNCIVQPSAETNERLLQHLPPSKFPLLNQKRKNYPHIRKLTDIHAGSTGWKLVLDSDMLFFRTPGVILNWLQAPASPLFLHDPVYAYHYSLAAMEQLTGNVLKSNLNVGAAGLLSDGIDWDKVEYWIKALEQRYGSSYLLEQALSAMLVAGQQPIVAAAEDYTVMPDKQEALHPAAVMHHYVAGSKEWYYKYAWKTI